MAGVYYDMCFLQLNRACSKIDKEEFQFLRAKKELKCNRVMIIGSEIIPPAKILEVLV